jgi:PD-(D/E)XK nuclease superfamily
MIRGQMPDRSDSLDGTGLRAPRSISVTQLVTAQTCPLRVVLETSHPGALGPLPSSTPAAYVGQVFHGVVEDARRGMAGDPPRRETLEDCWRNRLRGAQARAAAEGDESWLPLCRSWRRLERVRLRALDLARKQRVRSNRGGGSPQTEVSLASSDGRLVGRVDAIERIGGRTVLRDFKSGEVLNGQGTVKPEYRLQMLAYAGLLYESTGVWPDALELTNGVGPAIDVPYEIADAQAVVEAGRGLLRQLDQVLGDGHAAEGALMRLGRPDGSGCPSCRHRPNCPGFMGRLRDRGFYAHGETDYSAVDVLGKTDAFRPSSGRPLVLTHEDSTRTISGVETGGLDWGTAAGHEGFVMVAVFGARPRRSRALDPTASSLSVDKRTRVLTVDPSVKHT